ncbi:MAG: hypothetical protein ACTSSN_13495, partial [Candidatus Heimdallarchaeaceae archaeon]
NIIKPFNQKIPVKERNDIPPTTSKPLADFASAIIVNKPCITRINPQVKVFILPQANPEFLILLIKNH